MRIWIGKAIIGIGTIHSIFDLVMFHTALAEIVGEGLFNAVNGQPMREFAFWFIIFGVFVD